MSNRLPNDLIKRLKEEPGFDVEAFFHKHDLEERTNSIRINPRKPFDTSLLEIEGNIPWCENGFYLKKRPIFTLDPFFHAGCYYSQEASSMFLAHAIKELALGDRALKALDLCAAPGGKSTLLNSTLHEDSLLVSNEIIKTRAKILSDNLVRWGSPNVVVSNNDPSTFKHLPGYFDLLVVDAPCSGSGMFHKDHSAIDEWSLANVKLCSERQKRILAGSVDCLVEGGYLFYSTCSYSTEENEDIVDWLVHEFDMAPVSLSIGENWGIEQTKSARHGAAGYRFYPHKVGGEGFFFSVLQKRKEQTSFSCKKIKTEKSNVPQELAGSWLNMDGLYTFAHHEELHVFPKQYELDVKVLQQVLYLKNVGTEIGRLTGKELVPSHDLALSIRILPDLPAIELDLDAALNYLRKEVVDPAVNANCLKGWVLIRYKGVNLGWIKAMPNRINNYYPKESRIAVL